MTEAGVLVREQKQGRSVDAPVPKSPVCSYNEWDPLEEVIVGRLDGAVLPQYHIVERVRSVGPIGALLARVLSGRSYPGFILKRAMKELDAFIELLTSEGIRVRRPDPMKFSRKSRTPYWKSTGFCTASPRDGILIVGDHMIETASAWRSRFFEVYAYRSLLNEYFDAGAKWSAAPRPQLDDPLYDYSYRPPEPGEPLRFTTTEHEPVLDAADFTRCGRDLFVTRSNTTNHKGIDWMRRHLGPEFRIHVLETRDRTPMHIDTTFMPLAPGKVLVNPEFLDVESLPEMLRSWDILVAPPPDPAPPGASFALSLTSSWIHLNVLMLDEKRVVVEQSQRSLIKAFEGWGFEPLPCPFIHYKMFGGGFHCATLDVRRRGELQSYF